MFSHHTSVLALALSTLFSVVTSRDVFEELHSVPRGWELLRSAASGEPISLRISVKQRNVDLFERVLMEVSTPSHAKYGQHLLGHEVKEMLRPTQESSDSVLSWLQDSNITSIDDDGDWISISTDVGAANKLLDTEFQWFRNPKGGKELLRTLSYDLPAAIVPHINFVQPTTRFGNFEAMGSHVELIDDQGKSDGVSQWRDGVQLSSESSVNIACNRSITPQCLFELYNIHYKPDTDNSNTVGFASFLEEYSRYSDLAEFEKVYAPYAVGENFTVVEFNNGLNNQTDTVDDSGEANLDLQYILSVGYPTPVTEFSTGGLGELIVDGDTPTADENSNEPYLDFLLGLIKLPNEKIPRSISLSYGENEQEIPLSYATQVCQLFGQLGARGVTILFSSGDMGTGDYCLSNDGKNRTIFQPQFPAACPYVTSVGGTRYIEPEQATVFSSGGFSNYWPRPLYQALAVPEYLEKLGDHNKGYFNPNGRGFPDVAAQSYGYRVINQGSNGGYQGTSCAAPTFNGVVALLNSARISVGLPTLGFLNPFIYSIGHQALNDVTAGGSTGCNGYARFFSGHNGSPVIPGASWNATKGWDPVTGYGTPDFGKLLALVAPGVANKGGIVPA
ncbi:MAG: hypothetical protein M1818_006641 [Claussenomyces sp. TS43310]|nr:MAG: hypothetical protein M1818_006926 [Claussenomyces sp. TS43310]KAI9735064.1 MAG: hypothetical protein M1818_006641 [Claussenomyces sp. TS43310]